MIIYEQIFKKYGLSPTQQEILKIIGPGKTILEIGSSTGYMTKAFLENDCTVDVVENNIEAISKVPKKARKILNKSIEAESLTRFLQRDYDFVIMADVLEHLVDFEKALKIIFQISNASTQLIISLPNVACWAMRKQLFFKGDFEYQDSGLLDKTHLHFFTVNTLPKILSENKWKVKKIRGTITQLPYDRFIKKIPFLYKIITERFKNLSYYHFFVVAFKNED